MKSVHVLTIGLLIAIPHDALVSAAEGDTRQLLTISLESRDSACLTKAKVIGLACRLFAREHDGRYPDALLELFPRYLTELSDFVCPLSPEQTPDEYEYFGGATTDPVTKVLFRCKHLTSGGRRAVIYCDCSGRLVPAKK
jgi:hypothetical protein